MFDEYQHIPDREIASNATSRDHVVQENYEYYCSVGIDMVVKTKSFIFHKAEEEAPIDVEPIPDMVQAPGQVKEVFLDTDQNQISETTVVLRAPGSCDGNHFDERKEVDNEDDFIFHEGHQQVSLEIEQLPEPFQHPIEVTKVLPETTQNVVIETTIDLKVPESGKDEYSSELKNVDTEDDVATYQVKEELSLAIENVRDQIQVTTEVKAIFSEATQKHNINSMIGLKAPATCESNYSNGLRDVDAKDDFILHSNKDGIPLKNDQLPNQSEANKNSIMEEFCHNDCNTQKAQIPSVMEVVFAERSQLLSNFDIVSD